MARSGSTTVACCRSIRPSSPSSPAGSTDGGPGLALLHILFMRGHNAICDRLRSEYPGWSDDALVDHARLINAALIAKIHTVEWTPAILGHPTLRIGMRANWWGLAGERLHDLADLLYSFGVAHPGAITLRNYPNSLRRLTMHDGTLIDLAAIDVLRTRERGVPRYNRFRQLLHLSPCASFEELTDDPELREDLRRLYDDDTRDFRPEIYTQAGMDWIAANDMRTVLLRHAPELEPSLTGVDNAFAPWRRTPSPAGSA